MTEQDTFEYEVLDDAGVFILSGEICYSIATAIIKWIVQSNLSKPTTYDELTLIINSPGGELTDGFAIIDAMNSSVIPIKTVGLGQIGSCGFLIFINGYNRVLTPNTSVLCHTYSWGMEGNHNELLSARKEQDLMQNRILNHISSCTGLTHSNIKKKLLKETDIYLNCDECLELGICDEINYL